MFYKQQKIIAPHSEGEVQVSIAGFWWGISFGFMLLSSPQASFMRAWFPFMSTPLSGLKHIPKAPSPNNINFRVGIPIYELWGKQTFRPWHWNINIKKTANKCIIVKVVKVKWLEKKIKRKKTKGRFKVFQWNKIKISSSKEWGGGESWKEKMQCYLETAVRKQNTCLLGILYLANCH